MMDDLERRLYEEARKRVKMKTDFKQHRNVYIICMIFLTLINLFTSPRYLWVKWPALGWGLGVALHWLDTMHKLKGDEKLQTNIDKELEHLKGKAKRDMYKDEENAKPFSRDIEKSSETEVKK